MPEVKIPDDEVLKEERKFPKALSAALAQCASRLLQADRFLSASVALAASCTTPVAPI